MRLWHSGRLAGNSVLLIPVKQTIDNVGETDQVSISNHTLQHGSCIRGKSNKGI